MEGRDSSDPYSPRTSNIQTGPSPFNACCHRLYNPNPNVNGCSNAMFTPPQGSMHHSSINMATSGNSEMDMGFAARSEPTKRKRGRPRKYGTSISPSYSDKKERGSAKKAQLAALGGCFGSELPHFIICFNLSKSRELIVSVHLGGRQLLRGVEGCQQTWSIYSISKFTTVVPACPADTLFCKPCACPFKISFYQDLNPSQVCEIQRCSMEFGDTLPGPLLFSVLDFYLIPIPSLRFGVTMVDGDQGCLPPSCFEGYFSGTLHFQGEFYLYWLQVATIFVVLDSPTL
eukprot:Gb_26093 [translate_table: standard]